MERGRHIAHFEILAELGAGGMGLVYRARDRILGRDVALKIVRPDRSSADESHRILREARIAATLTHPHVAAVYEAGEHRAGQDATPEIYVAQELVEGETLAAIVARGPLPVADAAELTRQLLDALAAAHARGIVHRDIKPSNLMIAAGGGLKVLDFGIARQRGIPIGTTRPGGATRTDAIDGGTIAGTPGYMAPEQLRGRADARTDLHAVGCVLFEALTARRLQSGDATRGDGDDVTPGEVLRRMRPDVPPALGALVDRAVAQDPDARFPDARTFATALQQAMAVGGGGLTPARTGPGWRRIAAVATLTGLVALGLAAWQWLQPALAFAERDWVLVASAVNETGDAVFDLALESALETDLRQSRYVNVFDQGQLANTLAMMRLPASTPIDLETGRNVCRIAGIRVLLVPRILALGDAYQLEASLVDPVSGRVVDQLRVTARSRDEVLLSAIDEFTRLIRRRLGESLESIADTSPALTDYATPSWDALRYLRIGSQAYADSDTPRAARAFEQALEHDPDFAAALVSLGLLYLELLGRREEGLRLITAGYERASPAAEREHLMIRAVYRTFVANDPAGALEDYRFIASLYPDLMQPYHNSGRILRQLGRHRDAAAMFEKAHELDPRHAIPLWNLWDLHLNFLDAPDDADRWVRLLAELQPDNGWVRHIVAWSDVAARRFEQAEQGMHEVLSIIPLHPFALPNLGHLLLRRGAAVEAVDVYQDLLQQARSGAVIVDTAGVALALGLALTDAGRAADARRVWADEIARLGAAAPGATPEPSGASIALLRAALGDRRRAEALLARVLDTGRDDPAVLYTAARTHALLGDAERAAGLLRQARAARYDQPYFVLIDPALATMRDHPVIDEIAVRPTGAAAVQAQ
jgi:tetratricopeptide (TPR) repeat protein